MWRHWIALVLLFVLTGLPVSGTLCAMACGSASTLPTSHGSHSDCETPAAPPEGPHLIGQAEHDCGAHDAMLRAVATTRPERADLTAKVAAARIDSTSRGELEPRHRGEHVFGASAPPGTAPPTAHPVVLRV